MAVLRKIYAAHSPGGTFSASADRNECIPFTQCSPEYGSSVTPTASQNTNCEQCTPGKYSAGGISTCTTCSSSCNKGYGMVQDCTLSRDLVCEPCEAGFYSGNDDKEPCTRSAEESDCGMNTIWIPGNATTPGQCLCSPWVFGDPYSASGCTMAPTAYPTHSPTKSPTKVPTAFPTESPTKAPTSFPTENPTYFCSSGFWDHDEDPTTPCIAHSKCAIGHGLVQEGTESQNTVCARCEWGTMSATLSKDPCISWNRCAVGFGVGKATGDSGNDRRHPTCKACASGKFSDVEDATSHCLTHTKWCSPGTGVSVFGDATKDYECEICPDGTFSSTSSRQTCQAHRTCAAGAYIKTPGTASANKVCASCSLGTTFSSGSDAAVCNACKTSCPIGFGFITACTLTNDTVCSPCEDGFFSDVPDLSPCRSLRTSCGPGAQLTPGDATADGTCACVDESLVGDPYSSIGCTLAPTASPTKEPTHSPTDTPTSSPTSAPTEEPTKSREALPHSSEDPTRDSKCAIGHGTRKSKHCLCKMRVGNHECNIEQRPVH